MAGLDARITRFCGAMGRGGRQAVTADSEVSGAGLQGAPLTTPLWTGRVTLPAIRTPGHFRILLAEQELLQSDAVKEYIAVNPREARHPVGGPAFYRPGSRRLVFAEDSSS